MFSIRANSSFQVRVERSLFIGDLIPVISVEDITGLIGTMRKRYPDASHHPYAYRILESGILTDYSTEDGEPPGTAGRPILDVLREYKVVNVLLVVTRYFGGRKLGTKRLGQSYAEAARGVLEGASLVEVHIIRWIEILFPFDLIGAIFAVIKRNDGRIENQSFGNKVKLKAGFQAEKTTEIIRQFEEVLKNRGEIRVFEGDSVIKSESIQ
jgi:uncharacterized YigZ family protein